ncbi:MAG: hypothetical protein Q9174_000274 [Haloplaca sp. 1 TL-2023]
MNSAALIGGTGLVGFQILSALQKVRHEPTIYAIVRRDVASSTAKTKYINEPDSAKWGSTLTNLAPRPDVLISALGTTRAQAGSFAAQRAIDYDLNLALAKSAKDAGVETYVLISSAAVSSKSMLPYSKMKGELEDAIKALGIPYTVIVKPGLLMGTRPDFRAPEAMLQAVAKGLGKISKPWLTDWWTQDVDVIGRAAVAAAQECCEGTREKGIWIVEQKDIVRLGRHE